MRMARLEAAIITPKMSLEVKHNPTGKVKENLILETRRMKENLGTC